MESPRASVRLGRTGARPSADPDEAKLLSRLRAGEDAAYETLLRLHTPRMLAVARRFLASEDDAREAVQEAFVSAFRAIDRFQGDARLSTWLHRIVVNASLMKLRTRRRKPEESIEELLPSFREDGHLAEQSTGWREGADALIERDETKTLVRDAIERLPEAYRTVLLLRDIEEYDTEETALELDLTKAAVKTRLHRARQALRQLLDPHFKRPPGVEAAATEGDDGREEST
jgi:RNA polymerase sigma-70 factor (ECF subfamily)